MADRNRHPALYYLYPCAALFWALLILWLSLAPQPDVRLPGLFSWDKARHAAAYGLLTLLFGFSLAHHLPVRRAFTVAFALALVFGALVEVLQGTLTCGRRAEWNDLLANAIGAGAVWTVRCLLDGRHPSPPEEGQR